MMWLIDIGFIVMFSIQWCRFLSILLWQVGMCFFYSNTFWGRWGTWSCGRVRIVVCIDRYVLVFLLGVGIMGIGWLSFLFFLFFFCSFIMNSRDFVGLHPWMLFIIWILSFGVLWTLTVVEWSSQFTWSKVSLIQEYFV